MIAYADELLERLEELEADGHDLTKLQIVVLTEDSYYRNGLDIQVGEDDNGEQVLLVEPEVS